MRLPVFDLIDDTITLLERRREFYTECAFELQEFFSDILRRPNRGLITLNSRVKGTMSLREKILRKRLYLRHGTCYDMLNNLSDLIGMRAECRFLSDESVLYETLQNTFTVAQADGMFTTPDCPYIKLDLSSRQPERQNNGLAIYRIDGRYEKGGISTPFELQIKALVHVFWAEVEHALIYKNNTYQMMDGFLKKLLHTTYCSLEQIDEQLQLIFDRMQKPDSDRLDDRNGMQTVLAKTISDVFFKKMHLDMGFTMRLKDTCNILSQYILERCKTDRFEDVFMALYGRVATIANADIDFEQALYLEAEFVSDDPFCQALGDSLLARLNVDYDWNIFFRMLFVLEPENNLEDFTQFLELYRRKFSVPALYEPLQGHWSEEEIEAFTDRLLVILAELLIQNGTVSILFEENIERMTAAIAAIARDCAHGEFENADYKRVRAALAQAVL